MTENIEDVLTKFQAGLSAAQERDQEILSRLSHIESGLARIARNASADHAERVEDRHVIDKLCDRVERIERRLEIDG